MTTPTIARASRLALKPRRRTTSAAILLLVAAAVLLSVLSAPARAVTIELHHGNTTSANADFESTSGCIDTSVSFLAEDVLVSANQRLGVKEVSVPPDHASDLFLGIFRFDHCTNTVLTDAFQPAIPIADADFQIADDLSAASLNTTVSLVNYVDNSTLSVALHVNWTATEPGFHEGGIGFSESEPGFMIRIGSAGTVRDAEAAGSVTVGTENLTPDPSVDAGMFSGAIYFVAIGTPPA
jgi:hypothetical protein